MLTMTSSKPSLPILNDAHLLGGVLLTNGCPWGIAVIAGTGSVVLQLEVLDGKVVQTGRRGGLGFLLGDDGSGMLLCFVFGIWKEFLYHAHSLSLEEPRFPLPSSHC